MPVITFGETFCALRLVMEDRWFAPPPVPEVAPVGIALSGGTTGEDLALLPEFQLPCHFFWHSLMK